MMNNTSPLTPEIIIETLKRSSLNTVLIEGKDDLHIYRKIEHELNDVQVSFLPCGGRSALLKVYERKNELTLKTLFICDSDLWVYLGKPNYIQDDIFTTNGYSIENEIYQDGETILLALLNADERNIFNKLIKSVCEWYAFEIEKVINNNNYDCKFSDVSLLNKNIIESGQIAFKAEFLQQRNFVPPKDFALLELIENFRTKLRGKFIFQIFEKIFQERNGIKFNKNQLFELVYQLISNENDSSKILVERKKQIKIHFQ